MNHTFLTPSEVAERWRVSDQTVLNACRDGKLRHFRIGRQIRIHPDAVLKCEAEALPPAQKKSNLLDNIPDEIGD
jgi:excisionase family DNA binding protein